MKEEEKSKKQEKNSLFDLFKKIFPAILFLIVFLAVYFAYSSIKPSEITVHGLKIVGANSVENLKEILSRKEILIEEHLTNYGSDENTQVGRAGAELAGVLGYYNKTVRVYGLVDGIPEINCNEETNNCSGASVVIKIGSCNCMKVESSKVILEGSTSFFKDNSVNARKIFDGVLNELRK